jgi:hypothetical protein
MYAILHWRGACASRLFVFRLRRAATICFEDVRLLTSVYLAQFIVWRALRRGGEKPIV